MILKSSAVKLSVYLVAVLAIVGCQRPEGEGTSLVSFTVPKSVNSSLSASFVPPGKKACYGVNVTASDIPVRSGSSSCGPSLGSTTGFVEEGGTLTLEVLKGSARKFDLHIYLADTGSSCPDWDQVGGNPGMSLKTYLSGTSSMDIVQEEEAISLTVAFPGLANSNFAAFNMGSCVGGTAQLRGSLDSSGNVIDSGSVVLAALSFLESFGIDFGGNLLTASSANFIEVGNISVQSEVFSLTVKPDTNVVYGLLQGGQIVEVDMITGGYVAPVTCPFNVTNCVAPAWMQSISAGLGGNLYGLDHAGNIYRLEAATPFDLNVKVGANIQQVSYY